MKKKLCAISTIEQTMESFVIPAMRVFQERGSDVTLICTMTDSFIEKYASEFHCVNIQMTRGVSVKDIFTKPFEFFNIFRREKFDYVQYATTNASFYACIPAWLCGIKTRVYCQWGLLYIGFSGLKRVFYKWIETVLCLFATHITVASKQNMKYAVEDNSITGTKAGTPLAGAVYEIVRERSGKVVGYITTDARGVAASKGLPLGRYIVREVKAPAYWQVDCRSYDVTLEYPGQIIKLSSFDKAAELKVTLTKTGVKQILAGTRSTYYFTVANESNVDIERFYLHDKLPYDVSNAASVTTGTYNQRLTYSVLYRTNMNGYRALASNLLSTQNYSFALNALSLQKGEYITDIYFDFGTVPAGFRNVAKPSISVSVSPKTINGYNLTNRADAGGFYVGTWQTVNASWVTKVINLIPIINIPLPKTGY